MSKLYQRAIAVTAGECRVSSEGQATPLRVKFAVHRDLDGQTPDTCKVEIHGLNESSRARVDAAIKKPVTLSAGYGGSPGTIYTGRVTRAWSEHQPDGWVSHVEAEDGGANIRKRVKISKKAGARPEEILKSIGEQMGAGAAKAIEEFRKLDIKKGLAEFTNGLTMSGTAGELLDQIAGIAGFDWGVADGELYIAGADKTLPGFAVVLSRETGLVGAPSRHYDAQRPGLTFVKAKSLLQAALLPARLVELKSEGLSGRFRVFAVDHSGDNYGPDFYSEIVASKVAA